MKYLRSILYVSVLLFCVSCSSDDESMQGPTLTFVSQSPHLAGNTEWPAATPFTVKLQGASNSDIKAITFKLDGSNITSSDITIDGVEAEGNPYFIPAQKKEFDFIIGMTSPNSPGEYVYTFTATDVTNMTGSNDLIITVK